MSRFIMIVICFLCLFYDVRAEANDTLKYSVVSSGQIKGFVKQWKNVDGSFTELFQFNDRGRGDSMVTTFREDESGFPTYLSAKGKDYMKNDVFEEFTLVNGVAKWKNNAEDGEQAVKEKMFYSGLKSGGGHFIKAMKANGNKLKMLPFGQAEIKVLQKHELGTDKKEVWLVETKGFGLTPSYSWVDASDEIFGYVNEWTSTIQKGYEPYIDELIEIQKKYQSTFYSNLATSLPDKVDKEILIKNVGVFDAINARLDKNKDVLVVDGIVNRISPGGSQQTTGKTIDGKGKTIIPGLWDMHVHFTNNSDGILHLAGGVTHVRDMGTGPALLDKIRDLNSGSILGPRIEIRSGFIDGSGELAAPVGRLINNVEEGRKAVQDYASQGYQQIKLYSSLKPEWVKPIIEEARKHKLRIAGHIPAYMTATQAINAGYNEVTHLNMLALNFFGDTIDTRSPLRFSIPAQKTASLDLNSSAMKEFIALLKKKKVAVDPTLAVFEDLFTARDKVVAEKFKTIIQKFPLEWQRNIRAGGGGLPVPAGMNETYNKSFEQFLKITKLLYDNGITLVAGTDGLPGFDLHRELELYVRAGIPANKVLQLATYGTAKYVGMDKEVGAIKVGKAADFVMIEGNPLENISNIRNTRLVITQGKVFDPVKMYSAVSIK